MIELVNDIKNIYIPYVQGVRAKRHMRKQMEDMYFKTQLELNFHK